jgi:hypothetical protein
VHVPQVVLPGTNNAAQSLTRSRDHVCGPYITYRQDPPASFVQGFQRKLKRAPAQTPHNLCHDQGGGGEHVPIRLVFQARLENFQPHPSSPTRRITARVSAYTHSMPAPAKSYRTQAIVEWAQNAASGGRASVKCSEMQNSSLDAAPVPWGRPTKFGSTRWTISGRAVRI